jgi:hypothetical protein
MHAGGVALTKRGSAWTMRSGGNCPQSYPQKLWATREALQIMNLALVSEPSLHQTAGAVHV